jgi:hypothetical protein
MKNYYKGRDDGLGNRVEEILKLEEYCDKTGETCEYYWNNNTPNKNRHYVNRLKCKNVKITLESPTSEHTIINNQISKCIKFPQKLKHIIEYERPLRTNLSYVAIHVRSTDKLLNRGPDEFTKEVLEKNLEYLIKYIATSDHKNLAITSDNEVICHHIMQLLKGFNFVSPFKDYISDPIYRDYFTLVYATEVYMCPKFSSYATTASILGGNKLNCFQNTGETVLSRYNANVRFID